MCLFSVITHSLTDYKMGIYKLGVNWYDYRLLIKISRGVMRD